jgi:hypothetical protein
MSSRSHPQEPQDDRTRGPGRSSINGSDGEVASERSASKSSIARTNQAIATSPQATSPRTIAKPNSPGPTKPLTIAEDLNAADTRRPVLPRGADIAWGGRQVRLVPEADIICSAGSIAFLDLVNYHPAQVIGRLHARGFCCQADVYSVNWNVFWAVG